MKWLKNIVSGIDAFQQRHRWLAFPLAVFKKYGDDQGGNQAGLLTYYAFLSLFPLLLVMLSIVEIISKGYPELGKQISESAFNYFPVVGTQLQENIQTAHRSGIGLVVGFILTFVGARGAADSLQTVANNIWQVPRKARSGFPKNFARSVSLIFVGGGGLIVTSTLVAYLHHWQSLSAKILVLLVSLTLNYCVFLGVYRLSVSRRIKTNQLLRGTLVMTIAWQLLQSLGSYIVLDRLRGFSTVYGIFALVLGLLFWISIEAQIAVYAMEVDVVRAKKLWPRSLTQPPFTEADKAVVTGIATNEERLKQQEVTVRFK